MARKKSVNDVMSQLSRIKKLADELRVGQRDNFDRRRQISNRENRSINTAYRYKDNIELSKEYSNQVKKIFKNGTATFYDVPFGSEDNIKVSQRTYMGLSNG